MYHNFAIIITYYRKERNKTTKFLIKIYRKIIQRSVLFGHINLYVFRYPNTCLLTQRKNRLVNMF